MKIDDKIREYVVPFTLWFVGIIITFWLLSSVFTTFNSRGTFIGLLIIFFILRDGYIDRIKAQRETIFALKRIIDELTK